MNPEKQIVYHSNGWRFSFFDLDVEVWPLKLWYKC